MEFEKLKLKFPDLKPITFRDTSETAPIRQILPTDPQLELGFKPQPPASVHPNESFKDGVIFWCYPYAERRPTYTPPYARETDLDRAPLIPDGERGQFLVFNFDWVDLNADWTSRRRQPFLYLHQTVDLKEMDVRKHLDDFGYIKILLTLDHVPRCGDYEIEVNIMVRSETTIEPLKGGGSSKVSVREHFEAPDNELAS